MVRDNAVKDKPQELQVDPRLPFGAWLDPSSSRLGLGLVSVHKTTPRDVPVVVIPTDELAIRRMGDRLTAAIGAKAAAAALGILGIDGRHRSSEYWDTEVEVDCPECASVWTATVQEAGEGRLEVTHMAYGCDHRAVLGEIEEAALESAREEASAYEQALNDEAAAKGY